MTANSYSSSLQNLNNSIASHQKKETNASGNSTSSTSKTNKVLVPKMGRKGTTTTNRSQKTSVSDNNK